MSLALIGVVTLSSMGPVSRPASICITVTPDSKIAGLHRALDRRGATPAREQGGVAVDAAQARGVEHHLRQDQAIGDHHHQIRLERSQLGLGLFVAQAGRLVDGNAMLDGELLDRARHQLLAATGGAIRLGVDGDDLVRAGRAGP